MSFLKNIQKGLFWKNVIKVGLPFLVIVSLFSLVFKTGGSLLSGDLDTVYQVHFANKQWVRFWLSKLVISILYAMYTVNKKMK